MNSIYIWIIASVVVGWCLRLIYEDFTRPYRMQVLGGKATVSLDPSVAGDTQSAVQLGQILNTSVMAMNLMAAWLEELQITNPRLPEECLTAQQWINAALNIVELQSQGVDPRSKK